MATISGNRRPNEPPGGDDFRIYHECSSESGINLLDG